MGWGSSADAYSNTTSWLNFKTREQAVQFAERQGWEVDFYRNRTCSKFQIKIEFAEQAKRKKLEFRNYGDNFAWNKRLRKPAK